MSRIRALINGHWHEALDRHGPRAEQLRRQPSIYREWITADGRPGPAGQPAQLAEPGRYHLYVSYACPWAHRTLLYRRLKRLEGVVTVSVLHPRMAGPRSWTFGETPLSTRDHLHGSEHLYEVYQRGDPKATTVVTVPMLWDRETDTIVNRESADIIRILDCAFDRWGDASVHFRPATLEAEIKRMNAFILPRVSAAVYRVGFARGQARYDREEARLFAALDALEKHLSGRRYLLGSRITEPDWHLFCTLIRFDAAYHRALNCSRRRIVDYPALAGHTRRLLQHPGVAETVDMNAIRLHYFDDHAEIDRTIVPAPTEGDLPVPREAIAVDAGAK
ncbi:MAG: glutathione S-transferase C-terminal domain-containing protein [Ectothiorhodospiraceae bacterium]|jgi:putative glutathione S-transferase